MFFLKRQPIIFDMHNVEDITLTYSLFYYYSIFSCCFCVTFLQPSPSFLAFRLIFLVLMLIHRMICEHPRRKTRSSSFLLEEVNSAILKYLTKDMQQKSIHLHEKLLFEKENIFIITQ